MGRPNYKTLLQSGSYEDGQNLQLTFNGLTVGQAYLVQLWVNDSRSGGTATRTEQVTAGNSVTLDYNSTNGDGGVGQYVTGTFTADATSQLFTLPTSASPQINAAQLRVVPEPASAATLAGAVAVGLLARRRGRGAIALSRVR